MHLYECSSLTVEVCDTKCALSFRANHSGYLFSIINNFRIEYFVRFKPNLSWLFVKQSVAIRCEKTAIIIREARSAMDLGVTLFPYWLAHGTPNCQNSPTYLRHEIAWKWWSLTDLPDQKSLHVIGYHLRPEYLANHNPQPSSNDFHDACSSVKKHPWIAETSSCSFSRYSTVTKRLYKKAITFGSVFRNWDREAKLSAWDFFWCRSWRDRWMKTTFPCKIFLEI